jgi:hypothetical protein
MVDILPLQIKNAKNVNGNKMTCNEICSILSFEKIQVINLLNIQNSKLNLIYIYIYIFKKLITIKLLSSKNHLIIVTSCAK